MQNNSPAYELNILFALYYPTLWVLKHFLTSLSPKHYSSLSNQLFHLIPDMAPNLG